MHAEVTHGVSCRMATRAVVSAFPIWGQRIVILSMCIRYQISARGASLLARTPRPIEDEVHCLLLRTMRSALLPRLPCDGPAF